MKSTLSLWALLLCLICVCDSMNLHRNKICYNAKICIHNGLEKCGVDSQGNLRRFFDSCDILEYNCLKGTDYAKTSTNSCDDLPPIDDGRNDHKTVNDVNEDTLNVDGETVNLEERDKKAIQIQEQEEPAINEEEVKEEENMKLNQEEPIKDDTMRISQGELKKEESMKLNHEELKEKEVMNIKPELKQDEEKEENNEKKVVKLRKKAKLTNSN